MTKKKPKIVPRHVTKKVTTSAKKKKTKKTRKSKKKSGFSMFSLMRVLIKWGFVLGLWLALLLIAITIWYARELPDITKNAEFEHRAAITILANDNTQIARIGELKGVSIQIDDMPDHLRFAVISIEDRRFYTHFGIDPKGIARAIYTKIFKGGRLAGGSTITQQLAKNLFLSHQRSLKRKVQEALLALWLEHSLTKDEILSAYLNRVYFGAGSYGVDAAARTYFNKPAEKLTLGESAILAGLLKAPSRYAPTSNLALAQKRGRVVLNAMLSEGYITKTDIEMQSGLSVTRPQPKPIKSDSGRYFVDWVISESAKILSMPEQHIIIETTLDPDLQNASQRALINAAKRYGTDKNFSQGGSISLGGDGAVYAMVGGVNYRQSQFNRATQALRSPGSALKPFIYLVALEQGWNPDDLILDAPLEGEDYAPENYNKQYYGEVTLNDALSRSLNTAAVRLTQQVGIGHVIKKLRKLGITSSINRDMSLALGSSGVSVLELSAAYAALMNEGIKAPPYGIKRILTKDGVVLYDRTDEKAVRQRVAKRRATERLNLMLAHVVTYGTGRAAQIENTSIRGKTGTSQDSRDAWFAGFTDDMTSVIWLGNDDNSPMDRVTGGSIPARIWKDIMRAAQKDKTPPGDYTPEQRSGFQGLLSRITGRDQSVRDKKTSAPQPYND